LGNKEFLIPLAVVVTAVLLIRRHRLLAFSWAFATGVGALLNRLLKSIFERTRPIHSPEFISVEGWSFPSGHAFGSMLIYGLLAYILIRHTNRIWHVPIALAAIALIILVGFSRVILQVHYLSDVLAGYASAAAWTALCIAGYEGARRNAR
jgi:membrane-associated phospholipid phosphatase